MSLVFIPSEDDKKRFNLEKSYKVVKSEDTTTYPNGSTHTGVTYNVHVGTETVEVHLTTIPADVAFLINGNYVDGKIGYFTVGGGRRRHRRTRTNSRRSRRKTRRHRS